MPGSVHRAARAILLLTAVAACRGGGGGAPHAGPDPSSGGAGGDPPPCLTDEDHDGVRAAICGGGDCDDHDPAVHLGALERCGDGVDQDCDGIPDQGCQCKPGERQACWDGDPARRNVGECRDGVQICSTDGRFGPCTGTSGPHPEHGCDGVDDDCNGSDGTGCGGCPPGAREICGNGLDDDCDGERDDPEVCDFTCRGADPVADPEKSCCLEPGARRTSYACVESSVLPACEAEARTCLDLDGDPATRCVKRCAGGVCLCGAPRLDAPPAETPLCGFETPCARMDCDDRQHQPCYGGPPVTNGVGACHGGFSSCVAAADGARSWDACDGQVLPVPEVCGNGIDDDCDGFVDEADGTTGRHCPAPARECRRESCGNGLDDDCDGFADDGCPLEEGFTQACFSGPPAARGLGICRDGEQKQLLGEAGDCVGEVLPRPDLCGDGIDGNCDGRGGPGEPEDAGCCVPSGTEVCNGIDDDCDGLVDEGLLSACGRCDDTPCRLESWTAAECDGDGTSCERVKDLDGGGFTLDPDGGLPPPSADLLLPLDGDLLQVSADTGARVRSVVHQLPGNFGAAYALDGTTWSIEGEYLFHRDRQGKALCKREVRFPGALAVDAHGDVWVLSGAGTLLSFDARGVESLQLDGTAWPDNGVRCAVLDLTPEDDPRAVSIWLGHPYADMQLGGYGVIWLIDGTDTLRFDLATRELRHVYTDTPWAESGIADTQGNLWIGGDVLTRVAGQGPYEDRGVYQAQFAVRLEWPLIASDGAVWGTSGEHLVRFDPVSGVATTWPAPTSAPLRYFTMDEQDRIFAAARPDPIAKGGYHRFQNGLWSLFFTDKDYAPAPFFSPSGLTPAHLRRLARGRGTWMRTVDGETLQAVFSRLTWAEDVPPGTSVEVTVRFAREQRLLESSTFFCGPAHGGELDLAACTGSAPARFARVEVVLYGAPDGKVPSVYDMKLEWTR